MGNLPFVLRADIVMVVLVGAVLDLRFRRIPNWLTGSALLAGFVSQSVFFGFYGFWAALAGAGLAFTIYLPLYLLRGMGAGDVKLMAALGALAGPQSWLIIFLATALAGGATGALFAMLRGQWQRTVLNLWYMIRELSSLRAPYSSNPELDVRNDNALRTPHGVLIACGCLAALAIRL